RRSSAWISAVARALFPLPPSPTNATSSSCSINLAADRSRSLRPVSPPCRKAGTLTKSGCVMVPRLPGAESAVSSVIRKRAELRRVLARGGPRPLRGYDCAKHPDFASVDDLQSSFDDLDSRVSDLGGGDGAVVGGGGGSVAEVVVSAF